MKRADIGHYAVILIILVYLLLPLIATLLYSFASVWSNSVLPEGLTGRWYEQLYADPRFLESLLNSFVVCAASVIVSIATVVPAVFMAVTAYPALRKIFSVLVMLPFAMPGVVSAVGLIKLYSSGPLPIAGTLWILIGAYFVFILPFMYQGIKNSFASIDTTTLMEAAELLHASRVQAFFHVILPAIRRGLLLSALLSFSILFGEFVLANILAGGSYPTVQVYLNGKGNISGHFTSAIVVTYFLFILVISGVTIGVNRLFGRQAR